jgi:hypothetical protein
MIQNAAMPVRRQHRPQHCPGVQERIDLDASPVVLQLSGVSPDVTMTIGGGIGSPAPKWRP